MKKEHHPQNSNNAFHIPNWLSQVPSTLLSFGAKAVYARLSKWSGKNSKAYRSASQLAKELGSSERQIQRYTQELKEVGLIGTYHPQAGGVNHFEFYEHEWMYEKIVDELLYDSKTISTDNHDTTNCHTPLRQDDVPPYDNMTEGVRQDDVPPTTHAADIILYNIKLNTTTANEQILDRDFTPEPVVVSLPLPTPTPTPVTENEIVPEIQIFISPKFDAQLIDAYRKRPVKTKNIRDELDFLSACLYAIEHRPEGISRPGRVNQQIKFTLEGNFEEPIEWANDIVKQRNARIAAENLKRNEENTLKKVEQQMKNQNILPGRAGFAATLEFLKKSDEVSYAEKNAHVRREFKPINIPSREELEYQSSQRE